MKLLGALLLLVHALIVSGEESAFSNEASAANEEKFQHWLENDFKAAKPQHQKYCSKQLRSFMQGEGSTGGGKAGDREKGSQFGQDMWLFFNVFKYWPMQNRRGYYVDSGANDAVKISNSLFFDICLGWDGLCVEPMAMYHPDIKRHRSCKLVPQCISDKEETVSFMHRTTGSRMRYGQEKTKGAKLSEVRCRPLSQMLLEHRNVTVDLWSLDVEGHELTVLRGTDFGATPVNTILIENSHINQCIADKILTDAQYYKYQQLIIDGVYVKQGFSVVNKPDALWFHAGFRAQFEKERALDVQRTLDTPHFFPPENQKPCQYA